ncbi:hypothetical protein [Streptomyces sp. NPDC047070]|uniref:hypothetical protein n=1 Tax=Streptomyces sp. NPDC047070 TaxID=3154923 RepID=UPI003455D5D7
MPIEPLPCVTGDGTPVEVTTCCAPSIAGAALCRADGSTVLLVVRSGCVDCGVAAPDPVAVGWIDAATGTFTAGALPADAGACEAGCIDTVCRQLCDDTDADGAADATYSELWCVRADGTAELVLTYQDDPSVPYVPVAPIDCTYACPETETVTLCDDSGPFLRRFTFLDGTATYLDVALDGQTPHVATGTVGVCAGEGGTASPCAEQTTPVATLGLCLADGTPIAVLVTRACDTDTVTQDGWLNLTTGSYSVGAPPVGTIACGETRSIQVSGTFCDVDTNGDVVGLVLIEYQYGPDGSIDSVRLVDATTGTTYVPTGEITVCPAGESTAPPDRDLVQLCDVAGDGTVTVFIRDYARSTVGTITGYSDYTLTGAAYAPTGTVGLCSTPCSDCEQVQLCDLPPTTESAPVLDPASAVPDGAHSGTAANGVGWAVNGSRNVTDPANWWSMSLFPAPGNGFTLTLSQPVSVTWGVRLGFTPLSVPGSITMPLGTVATSVHPLHSWNPVTRTLTALAGATTSDPAMTSTFEHAGPLSALIFTGPSAPGMPTARRVGDFVVTPVAVPFLRTICRDCDGMVTSITDTLLDASTAYVPTGTVGTCQTVTDEQCVPLALGEVCYAPALTQLTQDLGTAADGLWWEASTGPVPAADPSALTYAQDATAYPYPLTPGPVTGQPRTSLSTSLDGAGSGFSYLRHEFTTSAAITAITLSAQADDRPHRIWLDGVVVADFSAVPGSPNVNDPVAYFGVWSPVVTAAISLPAGPHTLYYEWDNNIPSAEWGALDVRLTLADDAVSARAQVVRACDGTTTLVDIETGQTVPDTATIVTCPCTCSTSGSSGGDDAEVLVLCDVDGAVSTPFLRHLVYTDGTGLPTVTDTALDGSTPYVPAGTVGVCAGAAVEPGVDVELLPMCVVDDATGGIVQRIVAEVRYDTETGDRLSVAYVDPVTWGPVALPGGTHVDVCPAEAEECPATSVIEACRCDDTDADGVGDLTYVELLGVDCAGAVTSLGTFTEDLSAPYTPVAPVECPDEGAEPATGVQAHRIELDPGDLWDAAAWPTLQSVTAVAHGGSGTVTTDDGTSTLHDTEAATWSVARDTDALLTGPLTIEAGPGTVTVTFTTGVTL